MNKQEKAKAGRFSQGLHGGEIHKAAAAIGLKPRQILDFSSNSNVFGRELTAQIMQEISEAWLHYPESDAINLHKSTARKEGLEQENVLLGNGAADLIWRFFQNSAPRSILFVGPVFSEYIRAAKALDIPYEIVTPAVENEFAIAEPELKRLWASSAELCVICTPNNPGGITYENIGAVFSTLRTPRVLVDLSYREFLWGSSMYASNHWLSYKSLSTPGTSVFCLHSFSNFFCCPGLSLGYLTGDTMPLRSISTRLPSWSINGMAQEAGLRFIAEIDSYRQTLAPLKEARHELGAELRRLPIFQPELVFEGPNFFCCGLSENTSGALLSRDGGPIKADELQNFLLQHKILVRNCDNIPGMPKGFVRIQVREPKENEKLLYALAKA